MRDGDSETAAALISLAPAGVMTGHRVITMGDEYTLLSEEIDAFELSIPRVRRQSGAARLVARELLAASGLPKGPLPRARGGATHWPPSIVGSLAHDDEIAVAAIARAELFIGLGIDVEPSIPLPCELIERVATPGERKRYAGRVLESRVLFAAKEAVYKAQYASDEIFLEFHRHRSRSRPHARRHQQWAQYGGEGGNFSAHLRSCVHPSRRPSVKLVASMRTARGGSI